MPTSHSQASVLLTGGLGYIGSHVCVALMQNGYEPVIVDDLSNCELSVLDRIAAIAGRKPRFFQCDVRDSAALEAALAQGPTPDAILHFAGKKAVAESSEQPLLYYEHNVCGSVVLLRLAQKLGIHKFVFSSSATVYGAAAKMPVDESAPLAPVNPYGETKAMVERILLATARADARLRVAILRYFNPVGAHESGLLGEMPRGIPNNLMPYIVQAAAGQRDTLRVFGADYPTVDGTGVRDYVHVLDLAEGHLLALQHLSRSSEPLICNLGTGSGYSVLQVLGAFEKAARKKIPFEIAPRRAGDVASLYANPQRAQQLLNWRATRGLDLMCRDSWRWAQTVRHP